MPQADIMIVDDNPANLRLLAEMLTKQGNDVRSFPLGRLALAAALKHPPDLFLLDINMPEMNGYEVCERLKSTVALADIPVIFLSALNDAEDKVKAFRSGAVDYISKPFQFEEVQARVEMHLKLHELRRDLRVQNERLEETVAARTRELAEANQRLTILDRSKDEFLNLISHELRTPLNGLIGVGEIILEGGNSAEEHAELKEMFQHSRERILSIIDDALLLTKIDVRGEQFSARPVSLQVVLRRALETTIEFAASRRVELPPLPTDLGVVLGDEELLVRALHDLLETAVKFTKEGETVRLAHEDLSGSRTVILEGVGRIIPEPELSRFFDVFSIGEASTPAGDLGLGPAVAYRILSLFGASVSVSNLGSSNIRLTISFENAGKTLGGPASKES